MNFKQCYDTHTHTRNRRQLIDSTEIFRMKKTRTRVIVFHLLLWIIYQNSVHSSANNYANACLQTVKKKLNWRVPIPTGWICHCWNVHVPETQLFRWILNNESISIKRTHVNNTHTHTIANAHFMSSCKNYKSARMVHVVWDKSQSKQISFFFYFFLFVFFCCSSSPLLLVCVHGDGPKANQALECTI